MEMLKGLAKHYAVLVVLIWKRIVIPVLYLAAMWSFVVIALYLYTEDFWRSAGIVSCIVLFFIVRSEFYNEFMGTRNPSNAVRNGIQEQKKR